MVIVPSFSRSGSLPVLSGVGAARAWGWAGTPSAIAAISLRTGVRRVRTVSCDELVEAVRMARMVGMSYRLDWSMNTGVQTLVTPDGFKKWKKQSFLFGRELPAKEVLRT